MSMSNMIQTPFGPKSPEHICKALEALELQPDLLAALEKTRHAGNEWADVATSAHQWIKNIQNAKTSDTIPQALENTKDGIAHCMEVQAAATKVREEVVGKIQHRCQR